MTHPLRIFCIVAVALALLVPAAALLRPPAVLDEVVVVEDAYLSMSLARSIAAGLGPWFGNGHTNGFQPLYVFLLVPFYKLAAPGAEWPVRAALLLLCTASAGALAVMMRLLWRMQREAATLAVLAAGWIFSAAVLACALNGLETALSVLLQWTAFACFYKRWWLPLCHGAADGAAPPVPNRGGAAALGAWLGLALFARVDNAFLFPALFGPLGIAWARRGVPALRIIGFAALATLMALLVNLPWFLYSWHYTGALFPTSGRAVRWLALFHVDWSPTLGNWYANNLRLAAIRLIPQSPVLLATAGALVALGLMLRATRGQQPTRRAAGWWTLHAPLLLFGLFLLLGYTWLLGGFWYFTRYLFPIVAITIFLLAEGSGRLLLRLPAGGRAPVLALLLLVLTAGQASQPNFRAVFTGADHNRWGYRDLGLWAARRFAPGTRVGSMQSGALSYFAPQLTVINLDGVVNHAAHLAQRENRLFQYAREQRIEYFVGWRMDLRILGATSQAFDPALMSFIGPAEGFRSLDTDWLVFKLNYDEAPTAP